MLASLLEREKNEPSIEIKIAATEQDKITALRLNKLFAELGTRKPPLTTHVLDTARGKPAAGETHYYLTNQPAMDFQCRLAAKVNK